MNRDGFMSENDFQSAVDAFIRVSCKMRDTWQLENIPPECHVKGHYLRRKTGQWLKVSTKVKNQMTAQQKPFVGEWIDEDEENDDMEFRSKDQFENPSDCIGDVCYCHLEHNVIYSHSYSVPVMYFNVFLPGGELLTLDDIWENSSSKVPLKQENMWAFISQQEHPYLRRPYFHLHPCHTAEFMKATPMMNHSSNPSPELYLLAWLSSIAPLVHLDLSLKYAEEIAQHDCVKSEDDVTVMQLP